MLGLATGLATTSRVPHARAADEVLLETLTIDATTDSSRTGAVTLRKGTDYRLNVSGTMTVAGPLRYDALYCYGGRTGQPDCEPPQHQEATTGGSGLFAGTTGSTLATRVDSFQTEPPPCCTTAAPYAAGHSYSVAYHPDFDGKLRLVTRNGAANCSTAVCPETTNGSFTVEIYGPAPPPPTTTTAATPPPAGPGPTATEPEPGAAAPPEIKITSSR